MATGTDFGGVHSSRDLHLIQQKVDVQPALPKMNFISVPGADGSKDFSTLPAGRVVFEDRSITWTFALYPGENWDAKHSQVSGALNGRCCKITLDSDPGHYYKGRLKVSKYNVDGVLRQITVEAVCYPYKLKQNETKITETFSTGYKQIILANERKSVVPLITVDVETTLLWKGNTFTVSPGPHKILDIELFEGTNALQVKAKSGTGNITISYQEGAL